MDPLESLRRQHHALLPPYLLRLPTPVELASEQSQQFLIERILDDPALAGRTAERGYERGFWRKVVHEIEKGVLQLLASDPDSELEVDERLYEVLAGLMISSPTSDSLPPQSYRTFVYDIPGRPELGERRVTLLEEQVAIQAGTTGLRTWTASLHLAHHILHKPGLLRQPDALTLEREGPPHCIELGAGTGFLSILLAQMGAEVITTDLDGIHGGIRTPLERLRRNVGLNAVAGRLDVRSLDWTDALRPPDERDANWQDLVSPSNPRTVIAADVIYDPDLVPALVASIHDLLSFDNIALIAATVRNPETLKLFTETCQSSKLIVADLNLTRMDPEYPTFWDSALDLGSAVRIMQIRKKEDG